MQSCATTRRRGRGPREGSTVYTRSAARLHRGAGFTLIELMITVAVIAILTSIAVPMYGGYVQRSKITEATSGLSDMRNRLEQYFLDNRGFPVNCIPAAAGPAAAGSIYLPGGTQYFTFACAFPSATTYTVTATGIAAKGMGNFAYTINESNTRGTTSLPSGWSGAGSGCWVTSKGGSC